VSERESLDAVVQAGLSEVDDEADLETAQAEIGEELGFMDRQGVLETLDFDHQPIVNDEIHPKLSARSPALVADRNGDLLLNRHSAKSQLVSSPLLVDALEQAGARLP
jgi:hypothetical protein